MKLYAFVVVVTGIVFLLAIWLGLEIPYSRLLDDSVDDSITKKDLIEFSASLIVPTLVLFGFVLSLLAQLYSIQCRKDENSVREEENRWRKYEFLHTRLKNMNENMPKSGYEFCVFLERHCFWFKDFKKISREEANRVFILEEQLSDKRRHELLVLWTSTPHWDFYKTCLALDDHYSDDGLWKSLVGTNDGFFTHHQYHVRKCVELFLREITLLAYMEKDTELNVNDFELMYVHLRALLMTIDIGDSPVSNRSGFYNVEFSEQITAMGNLEELERRDRILIPFIYRFCGRTMGNETREVLFNFLRRVCSHRRFPNENCGVWVVGSLDCHFRLAKEMCKHHFRRNLN